MAIEDNEKAPPKVYRLEDFNAEETNKKKAAGEELIAKINAVINTEDINKKKIEELSAVFGMAEEYMAAMARNIDVLNALVSVMMYIIGTRFKMNNADLAQAWKDIIGSDMPAEIVEDVFKEVNEANSSKIMDVNEVIN